MTNNLKLGSNSSFLLCVCVCVFFLFLCALCVCDNWFMVCISYAIAVHMAYFIYPIQLVCLWFEIVNSVGFILMRRVQMEAQFMNTVHMSTWTPIWSLIWLIFGRALISLPYGLLEGTFSGRSGKIRNCKALVNLIGCLSFKFDENRAHSFVLYHQIENTKSSLLLWWVLQVLLPCR